MAYRPPRPFSVRLRGPELGTASLTVLGGAGATVLALQRQIEDAFGFAAARQRLTLQPKSDVALAPTTTLAQLGIMSESLLFLEVRGEARPSPPRAGRSGGRRGAGGEARPSPPRDDRGNRRPAFPSPRRTPRPRGGGGGLLLDGSGKANGRAAHREEWQDVVVLGGGESDALYGEGGGTEGGGCYEVRERDVQERERERFLCV